jgi:hypothetical protein
MTGDDVLAVFIVAELVRYLADRVLRHRAAQLAADRKADAAKETAR